jgi:hypothetical protein
MTDAAEIATAYLHFYTSEGCLSPGSSHAFILTISLQITLPLKTHELLAGPCPSAQAPSNASHSSLIGFVNVVHLTEIAEQ